MDQKNKNQYHHTNKFIDSEVENIFSGNYDQTILGTIDKNEYPFLSKIVPMYFENNFYLLLSDLSEHTKNIKINEKASIYYALVENDKQKLNNPRLTLIGHIKKIKCQKEDSFYKLLLKNYNKLEKSSKLWAYFDDFNFYSFSIIKYIYVKGFGKAYIKFF